ncbi:DUF1338 domain protein [Cordyceps fumosorosea ARSEF 2679]|uniref:2-oxoadipate dioxygenase/decarboxylase n=1 Tax=Cordyceps fumosorosea (strain ARSEF 2679) TaxID=1081104 RepID=A0A167W066_CORFA|nr:DUF1338 domain protein [Cordyceps fumosorosea ARSEF 2679]OAA63169.1 DUF1338 domain protein [Cordyceps fumosorosea ARSEF 2679]
MQSTIALAGIAALLRIAHASPVAVAPEAARASLFNLTNDWDCRSDKNPVIALHGLFAQRNFDLNFLEAWLRPRGYCTYGLTYGAHPLLPTLGGVRLVAESSQEIVDLIDEVLARTGAPKVDLVGHSEGGLQALYVPKVRNMSAKVDKIVAIAPPTHGTDFSKLLSLADALDVRAEVNELLTTVGCPACLDVANGDAIKALNDGPIVQPGNTVTVLATKYDAIVTPAGKTSFIDEPGVTNILIQDVCPIDIAGHVSLAIDTNVFELTLNALQGKNGRKFSGNLTSNLERLTAERHGAIRLGTAYELHTIRRVFNLLDMHPVGYYDLSVAGLPMHATAFRPTRHASLERNPFRVFTTPLRPKLLASARARELSKTLLARRNIFSDGLLRMLDAADSLAGHLTRAQAAVRSPRRRRPRRRVPAPQGGAPDILADIACFWTAHINHLTSRTLDIARAQAAMRARGMRAKERIEGPPPRACPILLRQTSFLALEERVSFPADAEAETLVAATHTPAGRDLYDALLSECAEKSVGLGPEEAEAVARQVFAAFPDTWDSLRSQGLIYCRYSVLRQPEGRPAVAGANENTLEQLVADEFVEAAPITYEDFLPFSAAGIFHSNLSASGQPKDVGIQEEGSDQPAFESALGSPVLDMYKWDASVQKASIQAVSRELGMGLIELGR